MSRPITPNQEHVLRKFVEAGGIAYLDAFYGGVGRSPARTLEGLLVRGWIEPTLNYQQYRITDAGRKALEDGR